MARPPSLTRQALVAFIAFTVLAGAAAWAVRPAEAQVPSGDFVVPSEDQLAADAGLDVSDVPPTDDELPTLSRIRDDSWAQAELLPESEWSIEALAEALRYDPEAAFAFVRDSIAFDPYPGVLRGAQGTLAARAGNSYDRALLLAALLDAMGVQHRFAFADLTDDDAAAVLARANELPAVPLGSAGIGLTPTIDAAAVQQRARRDYARLHSALGGFGDDLPSVAPEEAARSVRHHAWVEAVHGSEWRGLDPTLADAVAGSALARPATTADTMPEEAVHHVDIRVVAESLDDLVLSEQVVLEWRSDAASAAASALFLYFQPDTSGLGGAITDALSGEASWLPVLLVDSVAVTGSPFQIGGRGSDLFGTATNAPELVSLRLEVETSGPGIEPLVADRTLLDRVPRGGGSDDSIDAAALEPLHEDEAGPFVMGQMHHVMVSTGGADRRDHALQRSASADFIGRLLEREDLWDAYALPDLLWPVAASDQALVVASETAVLPALEADGTYRAYVARPRVTLTTIGRDSVRRDAMAFATDLLIDDVALLPRGQAQPGETARLRLWYGALQTALETQFALGHAALLDPADRVSAGASLMETTTALRLLRPGDAATLPEGASAALRGALEAGLMVAVSGDPAAADAWWTIDPASGATRSILDPGLGGIVPRGRPRDPVLTFDSSYSHGSGARLAPRAPMQRPPGGFSGAGSSRAVPSTCMAGDSTGYVALTSCVSIPVSLARWLLFMEVATVATVAYYALR